MPTIQQLIEKYARYLLVNNIAWLCVWVVLFGICTTVVVVISRGALNGAGWVDDLLIMLLGLCAVLALLFLVFAIVCMSQLIKAATIPEIYAAQELLSMLSNI